MARAGSGHIEQLPSGSYRVHVYAGTDPLTGRELRHRETAKTMDQAQIVLGRLLEDAAAGRRPASDVKVGDLLDQYMAVAELEPATKETYEGYIRRTIRPALGAMELRKVRGPVLGTFYARLHRCGDLTCTGRPFTEHSGFLRPGDPRPAWQQAAGTIGEAIRSGRLAPGETLPSVRELAARHGLPAAAIQAALATLAAEGAITVRQGRRSAVSGEPATARSRNARPGIVSMTAQARDAGSTSAARCPARRSARSTPSCPELSARRSGGSGSSATRRPPRSCPRPVLVPLRLRLRPPWPRSSPPRVRISRNCLPWTCGWRP